MEKPNFLHIFSAFKFICTNTNLRYLNGMNSNWDQLCDDISLFQKKIESNKRIKSTENEIFSPVTVNINDFDSILDIINFDHDGSLENIHLEIIFDQNITVETVENICQNSNPKNNYFQAKNPVKLDAFPLFFELKEFASKLIYFRIEFYNFFNNYFKTRNKNRKFHSDLFIFLKNNPTYNLGHIDLGKIPEIVQNMMTLIQTTLDFSKIVENNSKVFRDYDLLTLKISRNKNYIKKFIEKLKNPNLNKNERVKLQNELKIKEKIVAAAEDQKDKIPKKPSYKLISSYISCLSFRKNKSQEITYKWIRTFCTLVKIINYYDANLKEIMDPHLLKLKCPCDYEDRNVLIEQNAYFDINSFTFLICEWIFYFFSPEFVNSFNSGYESNSKLFSRMAVLIFLLCNEPETVKFILSDEQRFDRWLINLEKSFEEQNNSNSYKDFFLQIYNNIKDFKDETKIGSNNLHNILFRNKKLTSLISVEIVVRKIVLKIYEFVYQMKF